MFFLPIQTPPSPPGTPTIPTQPAIPQILIASYLIQPSSANLYLSQADIYTSTLHSQISTVTIDSTPASIKSQATTTRHHFTPPGHKTFQTTKDNAQNQERLALPSSIIIQSDRNQMLVHQFISDLGDNSVLSDMSEATLNIGDTLNIEANQAPDLYNRTFDVVVAYN